MGSSGPKFYDNDAYWWDDVVFDEVSGLRTPFEPVELFPETEGDRILVDDGLMELRVDGGAAANDWLMQFQADLLGIQVERPDLVETTALGAAMLAGLGCGLFGSLEEASNMRGPTRRFGPGLAPPLREARLAGWRKAVRSVL